MNPETLAKAGTEHAHQVAFFAWCAMAKNYGFAAADDPKSYTAQADALAVPVPTLDLIHAVHNQGHGDKVRGARARAEGVRKGIPDIFWPLGRGGRNGLYIELKKPKEGRLSAEQKDVIRKLTERNYFVVVAYGWQEARQAVIDYWHS